MRDQNDHLSLEEILGALRSGAGEEKPANDEVQEHLIDCRQCSDVAGQYRGVMGKLDQYRRAGQSVRRADCPPAESWVELAAGVASGDEAAAGLQHAAECSACSGRLKEALEIVGAAAPPPPQLAGDLKSAGRRWQSRLADQMEARSRGAQEISPAASRRQSAFTLRWSWAAAAAAVVVALGIAAYLRFGQASPEKLLAQAYSQQRTIELRINQAPYGPIRVQRDRGTSQLNVSSQLLEAEVAVKRRMEKQPENPDFLREKAEVDLLNWDYQPAIETLGHALRLQPQSFLITLDLGTAHFERAEATNSPADYEASLNYLGDAIRLAPANPAALFNRAIVYERLYLYGRAIEDWEQFLKIEKDPGWRNEAEQRLQELRERERQHSQRQPPDRLTLAQFISDVKGKHATGIEEYLEVAERQILPNIPAPDMPGRREDQNFQAASVLADELASAHDDRFLKDLLRGVDHKDFQAAVRLLGKSSAANHQGHSDEAYTAALQAADIFRRSGNVAGFVAAGFEQAYALQFQSKAASCEALAAKLVETAFARSYVWLNVQLRLEQAICANMNRELGPAKNLTRQAVKMAKEYGYYSLYLRGLTALANLEYEAGDESNAWSALHEGLGLYWKADLPSLRAYSIYAMAARMAKQLNHPNVQFASAFEALQLQNPSPLVEAAERMRLADAALQLGELQVAEAQARSAEQVFLTAPQTDSVRWRELEVKVWLTQVLLLRGADTSQAEAALVASSPDIQRLSNRYPEFEYYDALAELRIRSGDIAKGKELLVRAIGIAEDGRQSLRTWRERLAWMDQHRHPYVALTELLFRSGSSESALEVWEHFRAPDVTPSSWSTRHGVEIDHPRKTAAESITDPVSPVTGIITYAFGHDGIMIWVRHVGEVHSAYLQVPPQDIERAAENFIEECARPESDISNLGADARYLYRSLVEPISRWLPPSGRMIVEPDGILGVVPLEALMDSEGSYLGTRHAIIIASSVKANDRKNSPVRIHRSDHALIATAPSGADGSVTPAPGAISEAVRVAGRFDDPLLLDRSDDQVSRVGQELTRSALFHFAGHAGLSRSGAAMLMGDGILGADKAHVLESHKLGGLKLAVFSACGTAKTSELSDSDSLVTAFLQAGTQNVVASRWNVDSVATADFMDLFYARLLSGASVADALQGATMTLRKAPEHAHPYYWAAFGVFGRA